MLPIFFAAGFSSASYFKNMCSVTAWSNLELICNTIYLTFRWDRLVKMSEPSDDQSRVMALNASAPLLQATPRPIFMPETFTGMGREWSDWMEQFEMAADVNNWDDALRLKFMGLLLSGLWVYSSYSAGLPLFAGKLEGARTEGQMLAPSAVSSMALDGVQGRSGYLKAEIGGFDCYVLVDTGASCSVIPKHLWLAITKGGCELVDYKGEATAANGGGMHVVGCWQTVCQFDSLVLVVEFLVSDIPSSDVLVQQGNLPVRVINVTNDGVVLKRGMKVGTLFTDVEVDREVVGQCIEEK
uniref:Peptidase A2 domain-containing protein n=1 Tax=Paramormyrops kingsleyae TaxID=1676925 RepID=A0A3B3SMD4_9TELE